MQQLARFGQETDNEAKYAGRGRLEDALLARFRARLLEQVRAVAPARVLDAGCGEGQVTAWLADALPDAEMTAVEGRPDAVAVCRARNPAATVLEGDLYALPFGERSFDLVLCTEVLEHLAEPRAALRELCRVSSAWVLVTVPHEPFFRLGNLAARRYVARLGSTPGHLSTWSRRGLLALVRQEATPVRWLSLFPWQAVVLRAHTRP